MRGVLLHQLRPPRQDEVAKISAVLAAADARSHRAADAHGRRTATEPEPAAAAIGAAAGCTLCERRRSRPRWRRAVRCGRAGGGRLRPRCSRAYCASPRRRGRRCVAAAAVCARPPARMGLLLRLLLLRLLLLRLLLRLLCIVLLPRL